MFCWLVYTNKGKRYGGNGATESENRKRADEGREFRLLDGDGTVYFQGRMWSEDPGSDDDFAPLDCYGSAFGCVEIQYHVDGEWASL